jgi:hypothetical protein
MATKPFSVFPVHSQTGYSSSAMTKPGLPINKFFWIAGRAGSLNSACDFCGSVDPLVRYVLDAEQWIACGPCSALIEKNDIEGLIASATARLSEELAGNLKPEIIAAIVREWHAPFWQARNQREGAPNSFRKAV